MSVEMSHLNDHQMMMEQQKYSNDMTMTEVQWKDHFQHSPLQHHYTTSTMLHHQTQSDDFEKQRTNGMMYEKRRCDEFFDAVEHGGKSVIVGSGVHFIVSVLCDGDERTTLDDGIGRNENRFPSHDERPIGDLMYECRGYQNEMKYVIDNQHFFMDGKDQNMLIESHDGFSDQMKQPKYVPSLSGPDWPPSKSDPFEIRSSRVIADTQRPNLITECPTDCPNRQLNSVDEYFQLYPEPLPPQPPIYHNFVPIDPMTGLEATRYVNHYMLINQDNRYSEMSHSIKY